MSRTDSGLKVTEVTTAPASGQVAGPTLPDPASTEADRDMTNDDLQAPNLWVGVAEAATYFGCCQDVIRARIREMSRDGVLGVRRPSRHWSVNLRAMDRFMHAIARRDAAIPQSDRHQWHPSDPAFGDPNADADALYNPYAIPPRRSPRTGEVA